MADDAGALSAFSGTTDEAAPQNRRGPLRPHRLVSARNRLSGAAIARLFQAGDAAALIAASFAATAIAGQVGALAFAAPILALLILLTMGAYRMTAREGLRRRVGRVLLATSAAGGAGAALLALLSPAEGASRLEGVWTLLASVSLAALHLIWSQVIAGLRRRGALTPNVVIVGATPAAEHLLKRALRTRELNVLGVFDDRKARVGPTLRGVPVLGTTRELVDHRMLPFVDRIIITVPRQASGRIAQLLQRLAPVPNPIVLLLEGDDADVEAEAVNRVAEFGLKQISGPPNRHGYQAAKRALDLILGGGLLLALAPLMTLVAIAIKLDSPGPAFFRQRRHGYLNEEIVVWKFRSMRVEASDATAARQVTAGDDRVTRVGRFIRKTSLDELPQLFNVISGEMSLVGPRPHAIGMLAGGADASKLVETYAHRHRIKPGLTGWAAIYGSRGPVDSAEAVQRRVALDLEYVERQSFWLDLTILLKTAPCLLGDAEAVR
jgi:Undecaprenyl-phosphate glucose phosphotransferase